MTYELTLMRKLIAGNSILGRKQIYAQTVSKWDNTILIIAMKFLGKAKTISIRKHRQTAPIYESTEATSKTRKPQPSKFWSNFL